MSPACVSGLNTGGSYRPLIVGMAVSTPKFVTCSSWAVNMVIAEARALYRLPAIPRYGRVTRQAYHVWGMDDAGILLSQRTGGGRAAAFGAPRERAGLPAGFDDREPA